MNTSAEHISVMLHEMLNWLQPVDGGRYVDATLGLGGHTEELFRRTEGRAQVLGLDRDTDALHKAQTRLQGYGKCFFFSHSCFRDVATAMNEIGWDVVDGVMADLGVSSLQLDTADRGFSFLQDGPLDMRMDQSSDDPSAADIVNTASVARLKEILWKYGEEPMAGRIARVIDERRQVKPFESTLELAGAVSAAYPAKRRALARNHPATKTFQALRIVVNHELQEIEQFLSTAIRHVRPGGRIVVISFHSLEDRIVKHTFKRESTDCLCSQEYLECQCGHRRQLRILTKKPVLPSAEEMHRNGRSRSAKLRVAEKIGPEGV